MADCYFYQSIVVATHNLSVQVSQPENLVFGSERGEFATLKIAVAKVAKKRTLLLCLLFIADQSSTTVGKTESFSLWEGILTRRLTDFTVITELVTFEVIVSD